MINHSIKTEFSMNGNLEKHIANPITTPWLDWIISGRKTFEGRVNQGDWTHMKIGDEIYFYSDDNNAICVIADLKKYTDFAQAFDDLQSQLVPIPNITRDEVTNIYSQYFNEDDIKKFGVVAVGVKPI
jgi:ASC-1-like (ASCH) protein